MNTPTPIPLVILGIPFHPVTNDQALDCCVRHVRARTPGYVTTPNLDFVMQAQSDPELARILAQSDLVIADGMPIIKLSAKLGPPLPERVAGSDLVVSLAKASAAHGFRVFHLGGAPGVPEKAGAVLAERFPGFTLAGADSPPKAEILEMDQERILQKLSESAPDILFVAFGAPKQEKWINLHVRGWDIPLTLGIGGSLDFLAGTQKRAPKCVQAVGLEWVWRMGTDPKRLFKRYWNNGRFLLRARREIRRIRALPATPVSALVPKAPDGHEDFRFQLVRWRPLEGIGQAEAFLAPFRQDPDPRPIVVDLTDCAWLSSLELGVLLTLGREWKRRNQLIFRTGACERVDLWLRFNLIDALLEPAAEATEWDKRLAPRKAVEVNPIQKTMPAPAKTAFGHPVTRRQIVQDPGQHLCTLYPPEELSSLTVSEWRRDVEAALAVLPADTQAIILEAEELRFLDSSGLGFFMFLRKTADALHVRFEIRNLHGAPLTTVKLARVEQILLPSYARDTP